jgi:hypothetical protein
MAFALALTNSQGCVAWTEALSESLKAALALTAQHNHTQTVLNADFTMSFICNEAWVPTSTHADAPRGMNFLFTQSFERCDFTSEVLEYSGVLAGIV